MTTQQDATFTNGVNVTGLSDTISAVKKDPSIAAFKFKAKNRWVDGGENRTTVQDYFGGGQEHHRKEAFVMTNDEPPILLGEDSAPNPVEYVLNALAGCLTTSMVFHAAARGIEIEAVDSELEGDIDIQGFLGLSEDVRKGYHNIRVNMRVKSDATPEQLTKCAMFSPVYDIVSTSVPVDVIIETY